MSLQCKMYLYKHRGSENRNEGKINTEERSIIEQNHFEFTIISINLGSYYLPKVFEKH
jgi:hypothetical protein